MPFEIVSKPVKPVSVLEHVDVGKKLVGCFNCLDCNSQWRSSQTKEDSGQECRNCLKIVLPFELTEKKSKSPPKKLEGGPFFGRYNCLECNFKWKSSDAYSTHGQECSKCLKIVLPFELNEKKLKSSPKKLQSGPFFGRFNCLECNFEWKSSDAYTTHGQECIKCLKSVVPYVIISIKELKVVGPFFSRYKCLDCKKDWKSSQRKNTKQKCRKCKKTVLPDHQQVSFFFDL